MKEEFNYFGDLLRFYMRQASVNADELSRRTKKIFGEYEKVSRSTIIHWIKREVKKGPRDWEPIIKVAVALNLTKAQANELLKSASYPSISELASIASIGKIKDYLDNWDEYVPRGVLLNTATTLHQLLSPKRDFTGRKSELELLLSEVKKGSIIGIFGPGGVGKTALALKLASTLATQYRDAQFFIKMKGTDPPPLPSVEIMKRIIQAFNSEAKVPEEENELQGLYNSFLHGQEALLLLDDSSDARQVGPLIPPDGCALIITARRKFTLPGMVPLDLGEMAPKEAVELLSKVNPRIGEYAHEIAKLCGYLPLSLRLSGSFLAVQKSYAPGDYIKSLSENRLEVIDSGLPFVDEEKGIEASLSLSYKLLGNKMQPFWRELAIFPDSFEKAAAAAVWGMELGDALRILSTLLLYSMVEWDPDIGRYRLHDLSRIYADEKLRKSEKEICHKRHAFYYLDVVKVANSLYEKSGESIKHGMTLFSIEWENITMGQSWAVTHSTEDAFAKELCSNYFLFGWNLLQLSRPAVEQISWGKAAMEAAQALKILDHEGKHLENLALAHYHLGELDQSIEYHEKALRVFQALGDRESEGKTVGNMGLVYADKGEYRRAIDLYNQHLLIAREIEDKKQESNALGNLGNAYKNMGDLDKAMQQHNQALVISRELDDLYGEATSLNDIGNVYYEMSDYRQAIHYYEDALLVFRDIGDRRDEGNALSNIGLAYYELGEHQRAVEYFEQALSIDDELGNRHGKSITLNSLGRTYADLGEPQRGLGLCEQALTISLGIGDIRGEAEGYWYKSYCLCLLGERELAIELAEVALKMLLEQNVEDSTTKEVREHLEKWKSNSNSCS